jgi:hypothetical protein
VPPVKVPPVKVPKLHLPTPAPPHANSFKLKSKVGN